MAKGYSVFLCDQVLRFRKFLISILQCKCLKLDQMQGGEDYRDEISLYVLSNVITNLLNRILFVDTRQNVVFSSHL